MLELNIMLECWDEKMVSALTERICGPRLIDHKIVYAWTWTAVLESEPSRMGEGENVLPRLRGDPCSLCFRL